MVQDRSRRIALAVLCASALMVILDGSIVVVALPAIQGDLGMSESALGWVVNAYLIAFGGLLLLAGRLGDLLGRRRMLVGGLVVFTVASAACAAAPSAWALVAARFVQGAGGAMASAVTLGMIVTLFPEPAERARAIGAYSFVGAAGSSIGVLAGGALTDSLGWRWVFLVNLPLGAAAVAAVLAVVAADRGAGAARGADAPGAALLVAGLMLAVAAIVEAGDGGPGSARVVAAAAAGLALLAAFAARQRRAGAPLVPPRVLGSPALRAGNAVQLLMVAGFFGMQVTLALYLQRVLGLASMEVGLAFLPIPVVIGVISLAVAPRLLVRVGAPRTLLAGLVIGAGALALLARAPASGSYAADVLPAALALGMAGGLALSAATTLAMSGAPAADAGVASGLANTTLQIGGAIGVAVATALAADRTRALSAAGAGAAEALAGGYRAAFWAATAFVSAAALATVALLLGRRVSRPDAEPRPAPR
ncbi:MAG: MFS transporter [Thermoleophilia bacterium]